MKRADVQYVIDSDEVPMVNQYNIRHLEWNDMVEEETVPGGKALGA